MFSLTGKLYDSIFGSAWHVQGETIRKHFIYVENAGNPVGSLTPEFFGQVCLDTATNTFYVALGTTNADWYVFNSGTPATGSAASAADELAIPVTAQYVAKTTGADGEALTLADGQPGQILVIALVTDGGGDGTLTPATKSGFTSVVLADAGDNVALKFVDATVGWVLLGTAGVLAPPVIVA